MKLVSALFLLVFAVVPASSQNGGKAEPKRIEFARGRSSVVLSESLSNGSEMEYVFAAKKGQKVTVANHSTGLFDFRLFSEENDMETEFDSSRKYTFEIPATGDYQFFIRKKMVRTPQRARFHITFEIR
ncbi:MAG: hypothetical protein ABI878_01280 [Acidobacteriota bacterium]